MSACDAGCGNAFPPAELAPVVRNTDGTSGRACRRCIADWIKQGFLWKDWPFWMRREGRDAA